MTPPSLSEASTAKLIQTLWPIAAVGLSLWSGYLVGETTTNARLEAIEKQVAEHDRKLEGRRTFMSCAVRNLDRLMDKTDTRPACPLVVEP